MAAVPLRVVSVRVFPGIEEQTDNLDVAVLGGQGECAMPILTAGRREQLSRIRESPQSGGRGQLSKSYQRAMAS